VAVPSAAPLFQIGFAKCTRLPALVGDFGRWTKPVHISNRWRERADGQRRSSHHFGRSLPVIIAVYVAGYLVLMDCQVPTHPAGGRKFESSLRWAHKEWVRKAIPPHQTPFGPVTTWNLIYAPMDRVWFHFFPRSPESVERLREAGYYG
jgi:hypothetical protein